VGEDLACYLGHPVRIKSSIGYIMKCLEERQRGSASTALVSWQLCRTSRVLWRRTGPCSFADIFDLRGDFMLNADWSSSRAIAGFLEKLWRMWAKPSGNIECCFVVFCPISKCLSLKVSQSRNSIACRCLTSWNIPANDPK
jgi:hypothetical protein